MVAAVSGLRARKTVVRNLRAAPAFLTDRRVDQIIALLDTLRAPKIGPDTSSPAVAIPVPIATIEAVVVAVATKARQRRKASGERRKVRVIVNTPAPVPATAPIDPVTATPAPIVAAAPVIADRPRPSRAGQDIKPQPVPPPAIDTRRERIAAIAVALATAHRAPRASALQPESMPAISRAPTPIAKPVARAARPAVRVVGVQNASSAIDWLRTHGVSVKAASTSMLGTKWIVSGDFRNFDAAGIVDLARKKGWQG